MQTGINTSSRHLNDPEIDWANFEVWRSQWSVLEAPQFAGRYFLGGRFEQPDLTTHEIQCVTNWSPGELFTSLILEEMSYLLPIQAGIKTRQERTAKPGRLAGRTDALRVCERIHQSITLNDFVVPLTSRSVCIFLEVNTDTTMSPEYWQSWAAEVMSYDMPNSNGNSIFPFLPCTMCDFVFDVVTNGYLPAAHVRDCLSQYLFRDGRSYKQCHSFWARTNDEIIFPPDEPEIFSDFFGEFSQQFDSGDVKVPVFFWQFAIPDQNDATVAGLNLSISNDRINVADYTLFHFGFNAGNDSPSQSGIDTATPLIATPEIVLDYKTIPATTLQIPCIRQSIINHTNKDGTPNDANGRKVSFVGRYFKNNENVNGKKRLTAPEMEAMTKAKLNIVSIFQANSRKVGDDWFEVGSEFGEKYFAHGFDFGILDGYDACIYADGKNPYSPGIEQQDRTPIYFATDYDPLSYRARKDFFGNILGYEKTASDAELEQKMLDLEDYFKGVAAGLIKYQEEGGHKHYDIGIYATRSVCERLYPLGIISHFWQLRFNPEPDNYPHANFIQTILDIKMCEIKVDLNIAWGAEGSWNSKKEFVNP